MADTTHVVKLAARPVGEPKPSDFEVAEVPIPEPGDGELLVRNTWMSVDPYMRGRMREGPQYAAPFEIGKVMFGGAVGEVVASNAPGFEAGEMVSHQLGWREHTVVSGQSVMKVDTNAAPAQAYLGVLGMPGLTGYVGILDIAGLRGDDVVFVSGAAGAVGSVAGQVAKLRGHRVIGSAGSPEKVAFVKDELGFDEAFDYHDGPVAASLKAAAPDGIDVYFDNVGGEHLEAAIGSLRLNGRAALCGAISQYNATEPAPGPRNLTLAVGNRLTLRGFIISDHAARFPDFVAEVGGALRDGKLRYRETVVEGIENAPDAFIGLLRGDNTGKMLVKLA
jgi:NADPH-dependent curcumin reductase CurA